MNIDRKMSFMDHLAAVNRSQEAKNSEQAKHFWRDAPPLQVVLTKVLQCINHESFFRLPIFWRSQENPLLTQSTYKCLPSMIGLDIVFYGICVI